MGKFPLKDKPFEDDDGELCIFHENKQQETTQHKVEKNIQNLPVGT